MQKMSTCLWFDSRAEEAANFYISVFKTGKINRVTRYTKEGFENHKRPEGSVMTIDFDVNGQNFMGLNGGPQFKFSEAISLVVHCESQKEIDYHWEKLSEGGEEGPCGWIKDKFGLSWQINPTLLAEMLVSPDKNKVERVTAAFLEMKKFDIAKLEQEFNGK